MNPYYLAMKFALAPRNLAEVLRYHFADRKRARIVRA